MSEKSIPLIVTVAMIALMFAWVQLLNFACPHWCRALKRRRRLKKMNLKQKGKVGVTSDQTIPAQAVPMPALPSRRLSPR